MNTEISASDWGLLNRLVRTEPVNPAYSRDRYLPEEPCTLIDLYDMLGLGNFLLLFVEGGRRDLVLNDALEEGFIRYIEYQIIDVMSGKVIHPVGALRAIDRVRNLRLRYFHPWKYWGSKPYRWNAYRMIKIRSRGTRLEREDEVPEGVHGSYRRPIDGLCVTDKLRSNHHSRCWKDYRKTQYR